MRRTNETRTAPTSSDCDLDDEYRRHEEREQDRWHQRQRERLCLPLRDWPDDEVKDLERAAEADPIRGRARPVRLARLGEFRQVNPFLPNDKQDSLGRPRQNKRVTRVLLAPQVRHLQEKVLRANCMGLVMDSLVTITWGKGGIAERDIAAVQARVGKRVREWAKGRVVEHRRLDTLIGWVWVHERGDTVGVHTHYLFCCPPRERTALWGVIRRAVASAPEASRPGMMEAEALTHLPLTPGVIDFADRPEVESPERDMRRQWTLFGYVTKTKTISYKPKDGQWARSGMIVGKRVGFSQHLLGGKSWRRFAADHGRPVTWMKDYMEAAYRPYPLALHAHSFPLRDSVNAAAKAPRPPAEIYPKGPTVLDQRLRSLKI
jgi:hypothetical protein